MVFPLTILPVKTELKVANTWTDISSYVRSDPGVQIKRGRADEASRVEPAQCGMTLENIDGRFSVRNPNGAYYGSIGRNSQLRVSLPGTTALQITGPTGATSANGARVTCPDSVATSPTGDIDLRFDADMTSWHQPMELVSKWVTTGNQRSYSLVVNLNAVGNGNGYLQFNWSTDGSAGNTVYSTVPLPVVQGRQCVRATLSASTGTITFYTASTAASSFTQLGNAVVFGATSIFNSTSNTEILDSAVSGTALIVRGRVYSAEVRSVIAGTLVANPIFSALADGTTSFADAQGNTWTVVGDLLVDSRDYRFWGEVPDWPIEWDQSGTDITSPIQAAGVLRRLGNTDTHVGSAIFRTFSSLSTIIAYWPMEDASGSTQLGSAVVGGSPLLFSGSPTLATSTAFVGSAPLPQMNSVRFNGSVAPYTQGTTLQLRFLLAVPSAGAVDGSTIVAMALAGTAEIVRVTYGNTSGGTLTLEVVNAAGATLTTGFVGFSVNGNPMIVSVELTKNGTGIDYTFDVVLISNPTGAFFVTGTFASVALGTVQKVTVNSSTSLTTTVVGHVLVTSAITNLRTGRMIDMLIGYAGESAYNRANRLCTEQGVVFEGYGDPGVFVKNSVITGSITSSQRMGAQTSKSLLDLLNDCAEADDALLFESRTQLALAYIPRQARMLMTTAATFDYSIAQMMSQNIVDDDMNLLNDSTVSRTNGSLARYVQLTGALSTGVPPLGVGTYDDQQELAVFNDNDLYDLASWNVHIGTWNEYRIPVLQVWAEQNEIVASSTLTAALETVDIGSKLVITKPPAWLPPEDIRLTVLGYQELLQQYAHQFSWNCGPEGPWEVGIYNTDSGQGTTVSRYESDGSSLNATMTTVATSVTVASINGVLWTHADGDYDIMVMGERMTVTNVTGTSSPQTFTVTRSVNGIVKTHASGEAVALFKPAYYDF